MPDAPVISVFISSHCASTSSSVVVSRYGRDARALEPFERADAEVGIGHDDPAVI